MKSLLFAAVFSALVLSSGLARADDYSFSFSTDPVGCTFTGTCSTVTQGSGIFTTGSPIVSSDYGVSFPVSPILAMSGQFDGSATTLATPAGSVAGALFAQNPSNTLAIFQGFPIVFTADGLTWGLFNTDGLGPPGTAMFIEQSIDGVWQPGIQPVDVNIIAVPEPASIGMMLLALMAIVAAVGFKGNHLPQRRNAKL